MSRPVRSTTSSSGIWSAGSHQFDLVQDDVQRAAALQAGRVFLVAEVHRHGDLDQLVRVDPVEVEVHRLVGDRVQLSTSLAMTGWVSLAVLQGHQVAQQLAGVERLAELVGASRAMATGSLLAAVEDAGHHAGAAGVARAAGAGALAHFNVQNDIGHGLASKRNRRARPRGVGQTLRSKGAA